MQTVKVSPVPGGWSVECGLSGEPALFISGMRAELSARNLASRLASAGQDVRLVVTDRSHREVGVVHFTGTQSALRVA